jgi:hypothetical protein
VVLYKYEHKKHYVFLCCILLFSRFMVTYLLTNVFNCLGEFEWSGLKLGKECHVHLYLLEFLFHFRIFSFVDQNTMIF